MSSNGACAEDASSDIFGQFTTFLDLQEMDFSPVCCRSQHFHQQFRERGEKLMGLQVTPVVLYGNSKLIIKGPTN